MRGGLQMEVTFGSVLLQRARTKRRWGHFDHFLCYIFIIDFTSLTAQNEKIRHMKSSWPLQFVIKIVSQHLFERSDSRGASAVNRLFSVVDQHHQVSESHRMRQQQLSLMNSNISRCHFTRILVILPTRANYICAADLQQQWNDALMQFIWAYCMI